MQWSNPLNDLDQAMHELETARTELAEVVPSGLRLSKLPAAKLSSIRRALAEPLARIQLARRFLHEVVRTLE